MPWTARMTNRLRLLRWILLLCCVGGCQSESKHQQAPAENGVRQADERTSYPDERGLTQLAAAQRRWRAHNISTYRIIGRTDTAFGGNTFDVTVRDGIIVDAWTVDPSLPRERRRMEPLEAGKYVPDGIFDLVSARLRTRVVGEQVTVTYDRTYDFPRNLETGLPGVVDAFSGLRVNSFQVVK
jgi:hypothetical protein